MRPDGPRADGVLVLVATPIGALDDATPRLQRELREADVVAAEDTRRLRRLAAALGVEVRGRVVSYFVGNEQRRSAGLLDAVRAGQRVVVVSDAGTPGVADPGYRLVAAAAAEGLRVTAAPGPSAVLTALAVSGLPVDRFCFEGFLPRRAGERATRLAELAGETRTLVFFEAPHRLAATLEAMRTAFGDERAAVACRELTKLHEEVRRGPLGELTRWASAGIRGEVTLVVSGAPTSAGAEPSPADLAAAVRDREAAGTPRKEAVGDIARELGVPKRSVYAAVIAGSTPVTGQPPTPSR